MAKNQQFKVGDRFVVVDVPWLEANGIEGVVNETTSDGIVAYVTMDKPCIDNGKVRLDRDGAISTQYMRKVA